MQKKTKKLKEDVPPKQKKKKKRKQSNILLKTLVKVNTTNPRNFHFIYSENLFFPDLSSSC